MKASVENSLQLIEDGAIADAMTMCETLQKDPEQRPDALHILGVAAAQEGQTDRAIDLLSQAVQSDPDNLERRLNLGVIAMELGAHAIAVEHFSAVARARPEHPVPATLLGAALAASGRFPEAVSAHEHAVSVAPGNATAWFHLAQAYETWGKMEAAEAGFEYAAKLDASEAEIHFALGRARAQLRRFDGAIEAFEQALRIDPHHAGARTSLGVARRRIGQLERGLEEQQRAFETDPTDVDVRWNLAISHLFHGRWASGFRHFEARRERRPQSEREGHGVPWDGGPLPEATLIVEREQGLGDSLMFARFLEEAGRRAAHAVFRAHPSLVPLLQESLRFDNVSVVPFEPANAREVYAPIMSLPHLLGLLPPFGGAPYLHLSSARRAEGEARLGPKRGKPRVGLVWQGNPSYPEDAQRSIPLAQLEPLLQRADIEVISLQQIDGLDQLQALESHLRPRELGLDVDAGGAFVDTAAVMLALDLVVTTDTSAAHLAGALGVETALILSALPDWRWGQGTETWYPSMQACQQSVPGDWSGAVQAVMQSIQDRFFKAVAVGA